MRSAPHLEDVGDRPFIRAGWRQPGAGTLAGVFANERTPSRTVISSWQKKRYTRTQESSDRREGRPLSFDLLPTPVTRTESSRPFIDNAWTIPTSDGVTREGKPRPDCLMMGTSHMFEPVIRVARMSGRIRGSNADAKGQ